jgi:hypothetical protein
MFSEPVKESPLMKYYNVTNPYLLQSSLQESQYTCVEIVEQTSTEKIISQLNKRKINKFLFEIPRARIYWSIKLSYYIFFLVQKRKKENPSVEKETVKSINSQLLKDLKEEKKERKRQSVKEIRLLHSFSSALLFCGLSTCKRETCISTFII